MRTLGTLVLFPPVLIACLLMAAGVGAVMLMDEVLVKWDSLIGRMK